MPLMEIERPTAAQAAMADVREELARRARSGSAGACPVELAGALVGLCAAQSCGKCVPCRVGLAQMAALIGRILDGGADAADLRTLERTARAAYESADCAIGYEAGAAVLRALDGHAADFASHVGCGRCAAGPREAVPCRSGCPAHVDIPGYVALVRAGRPADAVRLIRKDNPFPLACALICEHPCEVPCRRGVVDAPVGIRGLKRYAVERAPEAFDPASPAAAPFRHPATGRRVAVVGGGPAGLTAAYYLALMGHAPVVFEQRDRLGGMMRYGIPAYRFPREELDRELDWLLAQGIEARTGVSVPGDVTLTALREEFDAVYLAVGAHAEKRLGVPGEDAEGVLSAVQMLRAIGDGLQPDFSGERVAVVGGGNVAMDVARSAVRLGAASVTVVYRRRAEDMTAQREEVEGAIAEGCDILALHAPLRVVAEGGRVTGLEVQPQVIGAYDRGRPKPRAADAPPMTLPCDRVLVAIGQGVDSDGLVDDGVPVEWGRVVAGSFGQVEGLPGVFAGGDCETDPATVIRAIAAGKAAARNIDAHLGFSHDIRFDGDIPAPAGGGCGPCGRADAPERPAAERRGDFAPVEGCLTDEEAAQESGRCLRCDRFGLGALRGGRSLSW